MVSRYVKLALKYCIHERWFTVNPITKQKEFEPNDIWYALLEIRDYELRNRQKINQMEKLCKI